MRVNFGFTSRFNNRPLSVAGISMVMLTIFFIASSFTEHSDRDLRVKQVNLIIRQIGHRLLLQAGDSTSRVLPVAEIKKGTFLLRFENKFVFSHDSLIVLSRSFLPKTQFPSGYIVTVQDCRKGDIVFGFQVSNTSPDILPCGGRSQPAGCYTIEFDIPDLYQPVKQQKAAIGPWNESIKTDPPDGNQQTKGLKMTVFQGNSRIMPQSSESWPWSFISLILSGVLLLLGVTMLIWRFRKNLHPVSMENQDQAITKEQVPEPAVLGKFLFNSERQHLLFGTEVIRLTDKECKVLDLLYKNFGELIARETLMQEVWLNEGVITGRSLDMFVSKLRKKLSPDPELRITNVHGKGYMLETT